jgi:hypothetical protein
MRYYAAADASKTVRGQLGISVMFSPRKRSTDGSPDHHGPILERALGSPDSDTRTSPPTRLVPPRRRERSP